VKREQHPVMKASLRAR